MQVIDAEEVRKRITAEIVNRTNVDIGEYVEPDRVKQYIQHVCFGLELALAMFERVLAESELRAMRLVQVREEGGA